MKNEAIDMKPVVDLTGATNKVLKNMIAYFEQAKEEAKDRMIQPNKFWAYITQKIKTEAKLTNEMLLNAGMSVPVVMECLTEAEPVEKIPYQNLYLTMADKSTKKIALKDALAKIAPFTKQFKSPVEAMMMGDPETILKVVQHIYGKDVEAWSVPAEQECAMPQLASACLVELYKVEKYADKANSMLFEVVEGKIVVKKDADKALVDAYDKKDKAYLLKMFVNVLPDYPEVLLQESQTVLNLLSKEVMDKLFPNINPTYLINLKESELKDLVKKLEENVDEPDEEEAIESEGAEVVEAFVVAELQSYLDELYDRAVEVALDQVTSDREEAEGLANHAVGEVRTALAPLFAEEEEGFETGSMPEEESLKKDE